MHHMIYVRLDINKKIQNSNAREIYQNDPQFLSKLNNICIDVDNIFNITIQ